MMAKSFMLFNDVLIPLALAPLGLVFSLNSFAAPAIRIKR